MISRQFKNFQTKVEKTKPKIVILELDIQVKTSKDTATVVIFRFYFRVTIWGHLFGVITTLK